MQYGEVMSSEDGVRDWTSKLVGTSAYDEILVLTCARLYMECATSKDARSRLKIRNSF